MSSWFRFLRAASSVALAALFAALAVFVATSTGCGTSQFPTGSQSAANGVRAGASGQPHLVGFRVDDALPGGFIPSSLGDIWFFVTTNRTNTAGPAMSNVTLLVNGQQVTSGVKVSAVGTGNKTFWIQTTSTTVKQGSLVQIDATVSGSARLSNSITVPASGYVSANQPPNLVPGASPAHGATAPRPTILEFAHTGTPQAVGSYLSLVLDLIVDQNGVVQDAAVGHMVELLQPGSFTTGTAPSTLLAAFLNPASLPQPQGIYAYNVVSLDGTGFGNGTSSDGTPTASGTWRLFG